MPTLLLLTSAAVAACIDQGGAPQPFEIVPGAFTFETPRAAKEVSTFVTRETGEECAGTARLGLRFQTAEADVGWLVRGIGDIPDGLELPTGPVVGETSRPVHWDAHRVFLLFRWHESHRHHPLAFAIGLRAIDRAGRVGPESIVEIRDGAWLADDYVPTKMIYVPGVLPTFAIEPPTLLERATAAFVVALCSVSGLLLQTRRPTRGRAG